MLAAMASLPEYYLTPEEYLARERKAGSKSEYIDGVMYAMSGATSEPHNVIAGNLIGELYIQLRSADCRVYPSDMKVRVPDSTRFFYPDVSVVCGKPKFADDRKDVILNPVLIVEVLSDSTAAIDRGKKFQAYQEIESLAEYVLVSQDEHLVEHFVRQSASWLYTKDRPAEASLNLPSLNISIKLEDIYRYAL